MTNPIAIFLGALIIGFFALDHFVLHWNLPVLAMQALAKITAYIAFWR
ncbi:hypothetical protein [Yoonia sediminilitoris]|nr:hypothetical protein [Yoonia sediminilitoris]